MLTSRYFYAIVLLVVIAGAIRLSLPYFLRRHVNSVLNSNPSYQGHIGEINVGLWRGAYQIRGLSLEKTAKIPVPLFESTLVDLSVEWGALLNGAFVGGVRLYDPVVNFVRGPTKTTSQTGEEQDWTDVVKKLFPLRIDRTMVTNGTIHYRDFHSDPKVDITISRIRGDLRNLTNSRKVAESLVAKMELTGVFEETAPVNVRMSIDPYARSPTFAITGSIKDVEVQRLNDALQAYLNVDAEEGSFELYTELTSRDNKLRGYVKPLIRDLKLLEWKKDKQRPLNAAWEAVMSAVSALLTNPSTDRIASEIPIRGSFDAPETNTWRAIGNIIINAFVEAIEPGIKDGSDDGEDGDKG